MEWTEWGVAGRVTRKRYRVSLGQVVDGRHGGDDERVTWAPFLDIKANKAEATGVRS